MPARAADWDSLCEQARDTLHQGMRTLKAESKRMGELLRAARTRDGRAANLAPLLVLVASGAFVLGVGAGWMRRR